MERSLPKREPTGRSHFFYDNSTGDRAPVISFKIGDRISTAPIGHAEGKSKALRTFCLQVVAIREIG
jgi:hypothetical protein